MDYLDKLSEADRAWLDQFLLEYYQADFNFDNPIHPDFLKKDCQDRNNTARRQIDSIGFELQDKAVAKALSKANSGHYSPYEYCGDRTPPETDLWENYALDEDDDEKIF